MKLIYRPDACMIGKAVRCALTMRHVPLKKSVSSRLITIWMTLATIWVKTYACANYEVDQGGLHDHDNMFCACGIIDLCLIDVRYIQVRFIGPCLLLIRTLYLWAPPSVSHFLPKNHQIKIKVVWLCPFIQMWQDVFLPLKIWTLMIFPE